MHRGVLGGEVSSGYEVARRARLAAIQCLRQIPARSVYSTLALKQWGAPCSRVRVTAACNNNAYAAPRAEVEPAGPATPVPW